MRTTAPRYRSTFTTQATTAIGTTTGAIANDVMATMMGSHNHARGPGPIRSS